MSKIQFVVASVLIATMFAGASSMHANGETILAKFNRAYSGYAADQKANARSIIQEATAIGVTDLGQLAYILATAIGECHVRPIKEYRGTAGTSHRARQDRYWFTGFYGRGFVQLTWRDNYQKFSDLLKIDLVGNPDLALNPTYAAKIITYGMKNGTFTGLRLG